MLTQPCKLQASSAAHKNSIRLLYFIYRDNLLKHFESCFFFSYLDPWAAPLASVRHVFREWGDGLRTEARRDAPPRRDAAGGRLRPAGRAAAHQSPDGETSGRGQECDYVTLPTFRDLLGTVNHFLRIGIRLSGPVIRLLNIVQLSRTVTHFLKTIIETCFTLLKKCYSPFERCSYLFEPVFMFRAPVVTLRE
jgi:hypothetical protein